MNVVERRTFAEILLVRGLIDDLNKTRDYEDIESFVIDQVEDYQDDCFYDELFGYLYNPRDPYPLVPVFFAIRTMEVLNVIHRRLFEFKTKDFFRLVVPIFLEFSSKVKINSRSSDGDKDKVTRDDHPFLLNWRLNGFPMSPSNLFNEENLRDNFNSRQKEHPILFLSFFGYLFQGVYNEIGSSISNLEYNKNELRVKLNDLGYSYERKFSNHEIDEVFFQVYFQQEMKLLYELFCQTSITSNRYFKKMYFLRGFLLILKNFNFVNIPSKPEWEPYTPGYLGKSIVELDPQIEIVSRLEFLGKLWNKDLSQESITT
jgi:hypothetical protein